ncbi:sulfurtransferase TusA family protein [Modicisalibacter coralii]|uniref:sulfurtransferase TusA family protein n=1 Tax=Modicisalibacter coralii TaxID=2304602 RepID=UPI00100B7B34|nr:sulfurtransferase TusA family protein [Halomonas coralii]
MGLQPNDELDARGLSCPLPLLKAKQALSRLGTGQTLHVAATDPGSWRDFESFAAQGVHQLVEREERGGEYHYWIRKGGSEA